MSAAEVNREGALSLCHFCQAILADLSEDSKKKPGHHLAHHKSIPDLSRSAKDGCGVCIQLEQDIHRGIVGDNETYEYDTPVFGCIYLEWDYQNDRWVLEKQFQYGDLLPKLASYGEEPRECYRALLGILPSDILSLPFQSAQKAVESTSEALPTCKTWLVECSSSHEICNKRQEPFTPTRLVSVGGDEIKLCLSSELKEIPEYASLSHCWGTHQIITLTKNNINDFQIRIPPERLSKTFIEAIQTTRFLDLDFIWIDSLCIIQDDPEDWGKEASLMSGVYGGSTINIAASGASDGSVGCFFPRINSPLFQVRGHGDVLFDCFPLSFFKQLTEAPLSTRGWVFQERFLPRRTIHLTSREIFWECDVLLASESFPKAIPKWAEKKTLMPKRPLTSDIWADLVDEYSARELTFSKDKLVAISGLARIFHAKMKIEYIAGLWREELEGQLCWKAYYPTSRVTPPMAPSWSWASLNGIVRSRNDIDKIYFRSYAQILDIHLAHTYPGDPFGGVSAGRLRLNCEFVIHGMFYHKRSDRSSYDILEVSGHEVQTIAYFDTRSSLEDVKAGPRKLTLLPLKCTKSGSPDFYLFKVLIIEYVGSGRYQRVGYLRWEADGELELHETLLKNSVCHVHEKECVEVKVDGLGKKQFIIDLI